MPVTIRFHSIATLPVHIDADLNPRVLIVEYPEGLEGTDDSVGFVWFMESDLADDNNAVRYPGDRWFFTTAERAIDNATEYFSA